MDIVLVFMFQLIIRKGNIMIETKINFRVDERTNRFSKNGKEWVLYAKLRDYESWVLKTWDKKNQLLI